MTPAGRRRSGRQTRRVLYTQYITSPEWFRRREEWVIEYVHLKHIAVEDIVCVGCGSPWNVKRDDLHHCDYDRLGNEMVEDLWPVCRTCHDSIHAITGRAAGSKRVKYKLANEWALSKLRASQTGENPKPLRALFKN